MENKYVVQVDLKKELEQFVKSIQKGTKNLMFEVNRLHNLLPKKELSEQNKLIKSRVLESLIYDEDYSKIEKALEIGLFLQQEIK